MLSIKYFLDVFQIEMWIATFHILNIACVFRYHTLKLYLQVDCCMVLCLLVLLTLLGTAATVYITCCNMTKLSILPAECIYGFHNSENK
jgi:hypothetical protein